MTDELEEYPREPLDTDTIFAKFTRVNLSDFEVCALSLASMVSNPDVPAAGIYLTYVSHCDCYIFDIREFGMNVARGIASGKYKAKDGKNRRAYVEGYNDTWGRVAVADAMTIAFLGADNCPGEVERCVSLGVGRQAYRRIRDFVAGILQLTIMDYRMALEWAMGKRRDTTLQARWGALTGEKWSDNSIRDIMGRTARDSHLSDGCHIARPVNSDTWGQVHPVGFNDDELWRPPY